MHVAYKTKESHNSLDQNGKVFEYDVKCAVKKLWRGAKYEFPLVFLRR